ncbi:carbohydrate ABC transporter membrane protein 2 (CUT1 family) [Murinocardiopsis flavida]|uniref:Carbohydrate ABC transporter membrane protein 2 (CUT1 family) n=1 Tax=Murinocardiopsis flavida TaxID=645275 RepID=A0A2P8DS37_9ACTN|nr:carbohydrate ABC transporter permease [Murinocardiopsis flavida]PSL00033.1 carbohydrate ABC transporter membrane protein 2 (CUT1 family) [Murinocardiopsis flavida]
MSILTPAAGERNSRREANRRQRSLILGRSRLARGGAMTVLVVMALGWLFPLIWATNSSFRTEADTVALPLQWIPENGFTLEQYIGLFEVGKVQLWMTNSLIIAVAVTAITVAVSALAAYAFSRMVFRGRKALFALTIAAIMVPPQLLIIPLFDQMVALNLVDTYAAIILPQVVAPIMVFILKKFFDGIPRELEEAARMDGAGPWRVFFSVVLPLSRPILAAVSIFVFINAWNNFLWPFIVTTDPSLMTLPVGIPNVLDAYGTVYARNMASSMVAAAPMIVVFLLFQRRIVRSVATTGLGGQ